ncbi:MAG: YhdH/YhfP family quinone oxidoreductase [Gammaproteobacteria bacterium]|nr:YhdH/YhfP family quinone oxidoreductase [Pseudomonadales bacterium]MCP5346346.1 YhdH/YhfP family quinone oxidoreductase [Pseudomonadales bacterium]
MQTFKALLVEEQESGKFVSNIVERQVEELPAGEVLIRVRYSSLNYKDALSASGNKGVTRNYPHTPGIDAAGEVVESTAAGFSPGDQVIVIGYDLGMNTSGGFGQFIRVPAGWIVPRPPGLSLKESMIIGTAGFTAALCVEKLLLNGLTPEHGEVLVTGATGGVGTIAVAILSKLGYTVAAATGKADQKEFLSRLGAARVVDRALLEEESKRPLLKEEWAAAVDVVGGQTLVNILKMLSYGGSVACCGLVGSPQLDGTVFPFILRGVNLLGVDSVNLPLATKSRVWQRLASEWKLEALAELAREIHFAELQANLEQVLHGRAVGRLLLNLDD